jgi:hypothetical protein
LSRFVSQETLLLSVAISITTKPHTDLNFWTVESTIVSPCVTVRNNDWSYGFENHQIRLAFHMHIHGCFELCR